MNVLIHCYMDRSSALLEGEVCYIEVSVVRKGVTQQAAQGCSRQQQPIGGLDILYLNRWFLLPGMRFPVTLLVLRYDAAPFAPCHSMVIRSSLQN